jgi:hypothetical protein
VRRSTRVTSTGLRVAATVHRRRRPLSAPGCPRADTTVSLAGKRPDLPAYAGSRAPMSSTFVSYRRNDAPAHAGRIYDRLAERLGKDNVYMDLDSTVPGADFADVIERTIAQCDAFIVVIGRDWVSALRASGARHAEGSEDWVRREIAAALARNIRVIPVLVQGANMPSPVELPDDIKGLARRHAIELSETAWSAQLGLLMDALPAAPTPSASIRGLQFRSPGRGHRPHDSGTRRPSIRAAAMALVACALAVIVVIVALRGGDRGATTTKEGAKRAAPSSLSTAEYRNRLIDICTAHSREADRVGRAEGGPVGGPVIELEANTLNQLKALRPPAQLRADQRTIVALWDRRLSLMRYYYEHQKQLTDPSLRRQVRRDDKRINSASQEIQQRFAALQVTPECSTFGPRGS